MSLRPNLERLKLFFLLWGKEDDEFLSQQEGINTPFVTTFESLSLFLRYLGLFLVLMMRVMGIIVGDNLFFILFLVICCCSIIFTHAVFFYGQYALLNSPVNFLLHLLTITSAVAITGNENSILFLAYPLFQYAYLIYAQKRVHPILISIIITIIYSFVVIGNWFRFGIKFATFLLSVQILFLFLNGLFSYLFLSYIQNLKYLIYRKDQELLYTQGIIKSILDSIESAIVIFDEKEIITDANAYATKFLKMKMDDLIGKRIRSLFFDDTMLGEQLLSLRSSDHVHFDAFVLTPEAEEIPISFVVQSFYLNNNRFFMGIMLDQREKKRLQELHKQLQAQKDELDSQIRRTKELRISFSKHFISRILTHLTTLKNALYWFGHEKVGPMTEKQKELLELAKKAFELLETEIAKELELESRSPIMMSQTNESEQPLAQ